MFYRDYFGKLCFDDGQQDWLFDERTGATTPADWFWYL